MKSLQLEDYAKRGMNFLTKNTDKRRGYLPYFVTIFKNDPAEVRHDWADFSDLTARYVEAFILARKMLGISEINETESALRRLLISYFSENDGLSYRPKPCKPYYSTVLRRMYEAHVAEGFDQARVLWALLAWYDGSWDKEIKERITQLVQGLDRVIIKKDDYGYYDRSTFEPSVTINPEAKPMPHQFYFCGTQIHPLIETYRRTGLDKAFELAQRLSNYIVEHSDYFFDDGEWNCPGGSGFESPEMDGHTHSRMATIAGITNLALETADSKLIEKMKRCYDWFIENHCSSFGWSPEFLGRYGNANEGCETCTIMDQINSCLAFARTGYAQYYEQIERITRNQLIEQQVLDTRLFRNTVEKKDTELSCFHDVGDMVRGGFAGWAGPNDFIGNGKYRYCLMNCCGPSGVRTIFDVWNNIYEITDKGLFINIWIDREDEQLSIKNKQAEEGVMNIRSHTNSVLYIARRSWLNVDSMRIKINGVPAEPAIAGNYIFVSEVKKNDLVTIKYPLQIIHEDVHVNGRNYKVTWKGDTVVGIDPPGRIMPLYQGRNE